MYPDNFFSCDYGLKHNFFVNKSVTYPEKNTKNLKTKLSFKINFWAIVNEKGVFLM